MEHVFKDLRTSHKWAWAALIAFVVFVTFLAATPGAFRTMTGGWLAIGAYVSLWIFLAPSLIQAAHADHRHLLTVCIWTFVMVLLGIAVSFYSFFAIAGDQSQEYVRLLNVVPVFVAIWAAAVGWLIHFKLTTKAHRTNNAFAIIMETRKSSEFLRRVEIASGHFPPGSGAIPAGYHPFFSGLALTQLKANPQASKADVEKAEAIQALKYILNYYEFMAVGIKAGDLDEDLVYETIHPGVCALFERSRPLIDFLADGANPGGNSSTYCELKKLVARWNKKRAAEDAAGMVC